jgi:lipopolysaccharide transport system ATP-binding protein
MNSYAIRIENLSKQYKIGRKFKKENLSETLRADLSEVVNGVSRAFSQIGNQERREVDKRDQLFWALHNVSFEIQPGESVGIIGSNGAGKTTLLKILSRITVPTSGKVRLRGRVGSLLEVGTGFHPELTGRENIYLNGAILGMRRREINAKFDEIVNFSDIEKFLDTPVKFYSSGMRVRLAFSVAAHLEPEILLVDEVLAVGDFAFQEKCLNKMENVVHGGRTVIFVSHNMAAVKALCQKGAFIENGQLIYYGNVDKAISTYLKQGMQQQQQVNRMRDTSLSVQILQATVNNEQASTETRFGHDQDIFFEFKVAINLSAYRMFLEFQVMDEKLDTIFTSHDFELDENRISSRQPGVYTYRIKLPAPLLIPGQYRISIYAKRRHRKNNIIVDQVEHVCPFEVFDNGSVMARAGVNWSGHVTFPLLWEEISRTNLSDEKSPTPL